MNKGEGETDSVFPYIPTMYNKNSLFIRIIIFASIAASVISVIVNLIVSTKVLWSLFVVGGIMCLWISLAVNIRKVKNIPKVILHQVAVSSVLVLIWDKFTGWHNWSVDYVLPFLFVGANISLGIISKLMKLKTDNIIFYFLMNILFGIIPIGFLASGRLTVLYPSLVSVGCSIIAFSALILFKGGAVKDELESRFHL
ncbi:MAG: DUF6320 domain-containing protein [Clostridia bacterium]|nr:DUF6320 domain-containing protein [Clostridia bacterium]